MITEENIHKFWRSVSHACDSGKVDLAREWEIIAMLAFAEIIDFCNDLPFDQHGKNATAIEFLKSTTSNDGKTSFDISKTIPSDIYARGIRLAQITLKQYGPAKTTP